MRYSYYSFFLILCLFISTASSQATREINKIIPLKSDGRLVIDTYKGSITITTHEKPQVELNVKIESDGSNSRDAVKDVENTEIQIREGNTEVTLRTNYKKVEREHHTDFWDWISDPFDSFYSLPLVHFTIKMPRSAGLRIKDYKSTTHIEDLRSDLRLNTYKGEVEIENHFGGIECETYKGKVHVSFDKFTSNSRFETYKGNLKVMIPKENSFDLRTDFERRVDFASDFDVHVIGRNSKHRDYNYQGKINGGGPTLELKSGKGNIHLSAK